jgi:hypothetical protein
VDCGTAGQAFAQGNYSAMMMFDRSGSISTNDPSGLSLQAGSIFADTMSAGDEAAVTAFPKSTGNNRPFDFNVYTAFTADKSIVKTAVNSVGSPDGGTPLYDSMLGALSYTSSNGSRANKALLAFTDGENNAGTASEADVIARSNALKVPVFPIGLKDGDTGALGRIAKGTGGAFFFASEARQLSAVYKSLSAILGGRGSSCKVTLKMDLAGGNHQFTQSTGTSWTFTRDVSIDGATVPFTFKQGFDVVNR